LFYLKAIISPSCHHEQIAAAVSVCVANVYEHCRGLRPIILTKKGSNPCSNAQVDKVQNNLKREREREKGGGTMRNYYLKHVWA
jgi:hypothetical protein